MVIFNNVHRKFEDSAFGLKDINFEINDGEFVFITGPSGAGKTTILKLILRELLPTSGKILINTQDLSKIRNQDIDKLRQKIAMIFQDFRLLNDRTVFENVALSLEIRGVKEKEIEEEVKRVLELTSLSDKQNLFPAQLSGGELQRTCIARALVGKPQIILADEPTGNLDPATAREILKLLIEINELGTTVIMATHNVEIVDSSKKRVISLKNGQIVKDEKEGKYEKI